MTEIEAFERNYEVQSNGCWLWTAGKSEGYGEYRYKGKQIRSHRVSWILYVGSIPIGMQINHRCNCRACVNPNHLYLGTQQDNVRDAITAGTHYLGAFTDANRLKSIRHHARRPTKVAKCG